jgi:hypothetical protein
MLYASYPVKLAPGTADGGVHLSVRPEAIGTILRTTTVNPAVEPPLPNDDRTVATGLTDFVGLCFAGDRILLLTPNRQKVCNLHGRPETFDQGRSFCHRRHGCYWRLGEIPQQVVRPQTVLKDPPEEQMKTRLLSALVGLAISFALPTFAQQTNKPDPQLREKLIAAIKKHTDALDKNDAAALAALFTEDGVYVTATGPINGAEQQIAS